jgi:hypothetical protein
VLEPKEICDFAVLISCVNFAKFCTEGERERERKRRNCEVLQENFSVKWRCMEGCNLLPGLGRYTRDSSTHVCQIIN